MDFKFLLKITAVVLCLALLFCLATACGEDDDDDEEEMIDPAETTAEVTVNTDDSTPEVTEPKETEDKDIDNDEAGDLGSEVMLPPIAA